MKSLSYFVFMIIPLIMLGDIMLDNNDMTGMPYMGEFIPSESDTIVIVQPIDVDSKNITFILNACHYVPLILKTNYRDCYSVKQSIDSFLKHHTAIHSIIIIGDLSDIGAFTHINPYNGNTFHSDCNYGIKDNEYINSIPICRIPFADSCRISMYAQHVLNYLTVNDTSSLGLMGHMYDADYDSVEDYLYARSLDIVHSTAQSLFSTDMLITSDHMHINKFMDLSYIPDYMLSPYEDFTFNINTLNTLFEHPSLILFWGHSNAISTVYPSLSLSDIPLLKAEKSGIFCFFSCLAGNLLSASLAESLLICSNGLSAVIASSSETFYQYNRFMTEYARFYLNDNCEIGSFLNQLNNQVLNTAGINDYSIAHLMSYHLYGLSIIPIVKHEKMPSFTCSDSIFLSTCSLDVIAQCDMRLRIFSTLTDHYYNVIEGYNELFITNIHPNDTLIVSAYNKGYLCIDTVYVGNNSLFCNNFIINDSIGDYDFIPEYRESLYIDFNIHSQHIPETLHVKCTGFITDTQPIIIDDTSQVYRLYCIMNRDTNSGLLSLQNSDYNGQYSFPIERRVLTADSFTVKSDSPVYIDSMYGIALYMRNNGHLFDSCTVTFLNNNSIEFTYNSVTGNCSECIILFNYAVFHNNSGYFNIIADSRFFHDTLDIHFSISGSKTLYIFDPLKHYCSSGIIDIMRDSLRMNIIIDTLLYSSPAYTSYMLSLGDYPYNYILNDSIAHIVQSLSQTSIIFMEGNDCLYYDNASKLLHALFGIDGGNDGNDIKCDDSIFFNIADRFIYLKQDVKSADILETEYCFLSHDNNAISSFNGINFCQSIPLYALTHPDSIRLFYSYFSLLMDYYSNISIPPQIDISDSIHFLIHNYNNNPIFINIDYIPFFIDSINLSSSFIMPDSFVTAYCYKRCGTHNARDSLILSSVYGEKFSSIITYHIAGHSRIFTIKNENCISISSEEDIDVIIPAHLSCIKKIKKNNSIELINTSESDIYTSLLISDPSGNIVERINIYIPASKLCLYNILGQKIDNEYSKGVYFSKSGKKVHLE